MAEAGSITAAGAATAVTSAGLLGAQASFNPECAVGALCGSLIYFMWAQEVPMRKRITYFLISFIMGYLFAPVLSKASITVPFLGTFGPIELPAPAAFIGAALVVTVTLAILKGRGRGIISEG